MNPEQNNILIIGMGNPIRSDDGLGAYICSALEHKGLPKVTTQVVQQLDPAMIEDLFHYDAIVIVDAAISGDDVHFHPLPESEEAFSTSHHVNAALLRDLAKKIYGKEIRFYLCAVRGEDFGIGDGLSGTAQKNAGKAITTLTGWLQSSMLP